MTCTNPQRAGQPRSHPTAKESSAQSRWTTAMSCSPKPLATWIDAVPTPPATPKPTTFPASLVDPGQLCPLVVRRQGRLRARIKFRRCPNTYSAPQRRIARILQVRTARALDHQGQTCFRRVAMRTAPDTSAPGMKGRSTFDQGTSCHQEIGDNSPLLHENRSALFLTNPARRHLT